MNVSLTTSTIFLYKFSITLLWLFFTFSFFPFKKNIVQFPPHRCYQPWIDYSVAGEKNFSFSPLFWNKIYQGIKRLVFWQGNLKSNVHMSLFLRNKNINIQKKLFCKGFLSAILMILLLYIPLMCFRHFTTASDIVFFSKPNRSSLDGPKEVPAHALSCSWLMSIREIETLYWFIFSDLSVIAGMKKVMLEESPSISLLSVCMQCLLKMI